MLLLGDSIPAASGILNPDEAGCGRIAADTDHYRLENLARAGRDSTDLIRSIEEDSVCVFV